MVLWIWKLLEQFWRYFPPARRHLLGIHFWTFCLFSGYPNCGSFEAVLEIFLPSLEASLWETVLNILEVLWISKLWYLWSSFGDISHQFWRYFSTNVSMGYIFWIYGLYSGSLNCDYFGAVLIIFLPSFGDNSPQMYPLDTFLNMTGSLDLQTASFEAVLEIWYFSPAWRQLPGMH